MKLTSFKRSPHRGARRCRWRGAFLLGVWICGCLWGWSKALALTPADLIIVYNRKVPESQELARYYADKRLVPLNNLVGVEISGAEEISRAEYDQKLLPPVRAKVESFLSLVRQPAILLMYGLPLRVQEAPLTEAERRFKGQVETKLRDLQQAAVQRLRDLDALTSGPGLPPGGGERWQTPPPPKEFPRRVGESLQQAAQFLDRAAEEPALQEKRHRVVQLLVKLAGSSRLGRPSEEHGGQTAPHAEDPLPLQKILQGEAIARLRISEAVFLGIGPENAQELSQAVRFTEGLLGEVRFWEAAQRLGANSQSAAAVDNELPLLLLKGYQKGQWLPNPYHGQYDRLPFIQKVRLSRLMVGRLDGPSPEIVRRLVDDALQAEAKGLTGIFYLDARGLSGDNKPGGYAWFDHHLIKLYDLLQGRSALKVVLDKKPALFPPRSCPEAALYCGWYSAGKYVDAFTWRPGAVAYHVASYEATTLKVKDSQVWCKRLLEEGVAATLGPVTEPYLMAFPLPDQFFPLLMTGKLPLLEVYFRTLPHLSWQMILIGDPLYRPFRQKPAIR